MNKHYYLFGVGGLLNELGFDTLVSELKTNPHIDWDIFFYDAYQMHPDNLLSAFDGWRSFAPISESQFEILKALQ